MKTPAYRYEFSPTDIDTIAACQREHGFAIVRDAISPRRADAIAKDVEKYLAVERTLAPAGNDCCVDFVEHSLALLHLLEDESYMAYMQRRAGTDDLVVHRSAAIVRAPGNPAMAWHTDFPITPDEPQCANHVLNRPQWSARVQGGWFYLTGCNPENGGLAIIPDSHRPDWTPPAGFTLQPSRQFILKKGEEIPYTGSDVPGAFSLVTNPTDAVIFSTAYHATNPHSGKQLRLSAGLGLRPRSIAIKTPWALPEATKQFIATVPRNLRKYFDGYVGIDPNWQPSSSSAGAGSTAATSAQY
jgi:hypothetical protein